jgi:hypothetical protein
MNTFSQFAKIASYIAVRRLGWLPDQFWSSTVQDFMMAIDVEMRGSSVAPGDADLITQLKERFPDG